MGYPRNDLIEKLLHKAFEQSNKEVYSMVQDVRFSGSTCVSVLTFGRKLYVANVGDSRAILIRQAAGSTCSAIALSRDHKPEDKDEA
jgi:serine/threonine protein phosphatase PrpC